MIEFNIGGRSVSPDTFGKSIHAALLASIDKDLRAWIGSIRDPETGEFPIIVVKGHDIERHSISVEGSARLIEMVKARLEVDERATGGQIEGMDLSKRPIAFLCHASEDKEIVRRLANDLMRNSIEVFFCEWDIRAGDSLRQAIDEGLEKCTHFIAVLSPTSIDKPWVKTEMDAGFIQKVGGRVKFIPLRLGLAPEQLPPLLRGISSPALDNYETDVQLLISDVHGLTKKPPFGLQPAIKTAATPGIGLSPAAEALVKLLATRSEHGDKYDPEIDVDQLRSATGLSDDDIVDAVDELEGQGYVGKRVYLGSSEIGFAAIYPQSELFSQFDSTFFPWDPSADALTLASKIVDSTDRTLRVAETADAMSWPPRRMNPALKFLINRNLVDYGKAMGSHPWTTHWLGGTAATRRFAR
ncbi:MAG: TIR domain-containing protein, partial [Casimicrobiaceae bacterium]